MTYTQLFNKQRAFTLIELLVVILIIGILIAVAAPSFLGQQDKAYNSATKQSLTVVRKEAKAVYVNNDGVHPVLGTVTTPGTILGDFKASEPQYGFLAGPGGADTLNISVTRDTDARITACQQSRSGVMFCLTADEEAGLEQIASSDNSLLGVEAAYAATTDVVYSTGVGANAAAAEDAARCVLKAAAEEETPNCPGGSAGWSEVNQEEAPEVETPAPVNTVLPSITGFAIEGETLVANDGTWTNATSFNYQWQRNTGSGFENIDGALEATYQITDEDIDATLRILVIEVNADPQVEAASAPTLAVVGKPLNTSIPSFTGAGVVGVTLIGDRGTWVRADSNGFSYRWVHNGDDPIAGATSLNYTIQTSDIGQNIQLEVKNNNNGVESDWVASTSHPQPVVAAPTPSQYMATLGADAFWNMDDPSGSLADSIGARNLNRSASGTIPTYEVTGYKAGSKAITIAADGSEFTFAALFPRANNEYTLSMWLKNASSTNGNTKFPYSFGGVVNDSAYLSSVSTPSWQFWGGSGSSAPTAGGGSSSWYNLTIVQKAGEGRKLYINGSQVAANGVSATNGNFVLGGISQSQHGWQGSIDNVTYFDSAIDSTTLTAVSSY